ncbi:MAG: TlpA family protein disulfide reductase, partial [Planctomycetaceae bacterium]|nr:TlpA family protein disulfide reductase [Planctomycetaceae bacterium]
LLIIGIQIAARNNIPGITIDAVPFAQRVVLFAKQYPGKESAALIDQFLFSIYQVKPATARDKLLAAVGPVFLKYFIEVPNPLHKTAAERLGRVLRRLELPGKPMLLTGYTLDGKPFNPKILKDKVVIVQFWGTWCVPCREEMPYLVSLYNQYKSKGLEIVSINTSIKGDENPMKVKQFIDTAQFGGKSVTWTVLHEGLAEQYKSAEQPKRETVTKYYGIDELPVTVLIGRNGKVLQLNPLPSMLETAVNEALKGVSVDDLTPEERQKYEEAKKKQEAEIDKQIQDELKTLEQK